jgi:hypothetical protein
MAVSSYLTLSPLGGGSNQEKQVFLGLKAYKAFAYKLLIQPPGLVSVALSVARP